MEYDEMKVGFLCPVCKKDLESAERLMQHVDAEHNKKTKQPALPVFDESYYNDDRFYKQDIGLVSRLTEEFRRLRNQNIDHGVMEINQLVFRLEKLVALLNDTGKGNAANRKAAERKIVPWTQDDDVSTCRYCFKNFNITRRRHHCRLCGVIMCAKCSFFIHLSIAKYLIEPTANSVIDDSKDGEIEPFRVCPNCNVRLSSYMQQLQEKFNTPTVVIYYERMKSKMDSIIKSIPDYEKMANAGGSEYSLEVAANLRVNLLKSFEEIDGISKKIAVLDVDMTDSSALLNSASEKLRRGIRQFATKFLQDRMLTLPGLPTEEELDQLQKQRKAAIQRKIELERAENLARSELARGRQSFSSSTGRSRQSFPSPTKEPVTRVEFSKGQHNATVKSNHSTVQDNFQRKRVASKDEANNDWVVRGSICASSEAAINVWEEQATMLKQYIEKAKKEGRYDDVASLERNLAEIQAEILNQ